MQTIARLVAVVTALVVPAAGCSLALDGVRDDWKPGQDPRCSSSRAAPVADGVGSLIALGLLAALVKDELECTGEYCGLGLVVLGPPLGVGGLFYASTSAFGFYKTGKCRDAMRRHDEWLGAQPGEGS